MTLSIISVIISAVFVWALKLLSEHPEVQHKLHELLAEKLPLPEERLPTAAEVGADATPCTSKHDCRPGSSNETDSIVLLYDSADLEAVAQEILRVSGVASLTERQGQSSSSTHTSALLTSLR